MSIRHAFTSTKPEGPDPTLVRADDWNADHVLDVAAPSGLTGAITPARFVGGTVAGAPVSGTFAAGDFVSSQDGKFYICTVASVGDSPGTWVAVSGGADLVQVAAGAGNVRIPGLSGSPDRLPASPSAYDDEFDTLAGWTTLGSLDAVDITVPSHCHLLKNTTGAGINGIFKAAPLAPFTVTAKLTDYRHALNYAGAGLLLTATSPGRAFSWGPAMINEASVQYQRFTSYSSRDNTTEGGYGVPDEIRYVRLVVTSSASVACQWSVDGLIWNTYATGVNTSLTIANVGLYLAGWSGTPSEAHFDWIRFS